MAIQSKLLISSFPVEIMTEIWKYLGQSPSDLGRVVQVSKSWHEAVRVPVLWRTIRITESTDPELLRTWVSRAGRSGLLIYINFRRARTAVWLSHTAPIDYPAKFIAIMDILKPRSENWIHLQIYGPHYLHTLLKSDLPSSLPLLRLEYLSLSLDHPHDPAASSPPSEDFIFPQNLPLTTAEIVAYPMFWGHFPFQQLTHLTLGQFTDHSPLDWNVFAEAMALSPNVVSLGLVGQIPTTLPDDMMLPLNLLSVKHISLGLIPTNKLLLLRRMLHAPQLDSLALNLSSDDYMPSVLLHFLEELPAWAPHLATLALESLGVEGGAQVSVPAFFLRHSTLTTLRLNLDRLPASFWHALVGGAADPQVLPQLEEIAFVDCPIHSVQELLLLRIRAGKPISRLSIHMTNHFPEASSPRSKTWLIDHTKSLFLSQGQGRTPWVSLPGQHFE
ncbi:hypothetical protein K438DRAFT_1976390 [Mycena galopus ATCC 62051]|nr:hypothetical protein K438DRAFT_1976390 [Mycena galopus ATCC 62051]